MTDWLEKQANAIKQTSTKVDVTYKYSITSSPANRQVTVG